MESILNADLLVSATGATGSELALNALLRNREAPPPALFSWLEPFAVASHSLVLSGAGPCLRCHFNDHGGPRLRATDWAPHSTLRAEPACGAVFQPYGATELLSGVSLAVEMAIDVLAQSVDLPAHRIRVASERVLTSAGGSWSSDWLRLTGRNEGAFTWEAKREVHPDCPERH